MRKYALSPQRGGGEISANVMGKNEKKDRENEGKFEKSRKQERSKKIKGKSEISMQNGPKMAARTAYLGLTEGAVNITFGRGQGIWFPDRYSPGPPTLDPKNANQSSPFPKNIRRMYSMH
jgi:hypothetical protein